MATRKSRLFIVLHPIHSSTFPACALYIKGMTRVQRTKPYRFCFNSDGLIRDHADRFSSRKQSAKHIPSMDGYKSGDELTLAYEGEVATSVNEQGCEVLFRLFNAPFERPDEYAGPSMSSGDVVTFFPGTEQEISFAVARTGFERVDISTSKIMPRPQCWIRSGKVLQQYRRDKQESIAQGSF